MAVNEGGAAAPVHGHKFSTVVPGTVTAENVVHELTSMDLAVKMHYLRGVYYFAASDVVEGLAIMVMKEPMFPLLDVYYATSGRVRRSDPGGRPFVKCNDCGVRIIEAKCDRTMGEWLATKELSRYRKLVSDKVVGPDLPFSPTVVIQFTKFECGGMAVGLSWAHLLGDAVAATNFINLWGQLLARKPSPKNFQTHSKSKMATNILAEAPKPLSVKEVGPVGDHWLAPCSCRMETLSFHLPEAKLMDIESKASSRTSIPPFEVLAALFWQCLAKIRGGEPKLVTLCRSNSSAERSGILGNDQIVSTVEIDSSPTKAELSEIAVLIAKQATDENKAIEALIDKESGIPDVMLYGANLTFVDLQQVDLDGLELKGQKPIHVEYSIDGVGEEGAVLVQRDHETTGRIVTVILPEVQVSQLREVLENEWTIA